LKAALLSMSSGNFSSVPVLDYSLVGDPVTKPEFISHLRHALINVGFLYLSNSPVPQQDVDALVAYIPQLFALPQQAKDKIRMTNSEHFLGYSKLGSEFTKGTTDLREQFDFGTPHVCRWNPGDPDYLRLWGESQVCDRVLVCS
jgi:isopenicillin N synthase-like dioxygenase